MSKIRDNQVIVLSGETGCGKTTQVFIVVCCAMCMCVCTVCMVCVCCVCTVYRDLLCSIHMFVTLL